jgi:transglutaminase-like putative cysteine protease
MIRYGLVYRGALAILGLTFGLAWISVAADDVQESWDAVYLNKSRVGFFHMQLIPKKDKDRDLINVQIDMYLTFKRAADPISIEYLYGTIETPEGQVLRLDTRTLASKKEMRSHGDVVDGKMTLILEGSGQPQQLTIPWGPDVRGPYGAEMSIARKPMSPGESREVKVYMPELNKIGLTKLTAQAVEKVSVGGNASLDLLKVEQVTLIDGKPTPGSEQTLWVDSAGQIRRTWNSAFGGMETYRTTKEFATKNITGAKLDLNAASIIKVKRKIQAPTETREIVYNVRMTTEPPAQVFPNDGRQTITPGTDAKAARLVVKTLGPEVGEPGAEAVDEQYLKPNAYINSEDKLVVDHATKATAGINDPWQKAVAIEHWVFQNMKKKNFETAFAPASEVARDLEGDCSEHSVLTAAMCRAAGLPSRVVSGLVYAEPLQGFGFHMWDEVYVNRRWVAIDAAFDESQVDATHIKLSESSLAGISPFETFLSIVSVFGKTTIDPVEVR